MIPSRVLVQSISFSIALFFFINCGGSKSYDENIVLEKVPPFSIKEVYFQKWVAGVKEGGSGINLYFTLENNKDAVKISEVYFRNTVLKAETISPKENNYIARFSNENEREVIMDSDPVKEAQNTPPQPFPFTLNENEAVISYDINGDMCFYKISNIEEKSMLAYPGSAPKKNK